MPSQEELEQGLNWASSKIEEESEPTPDVSNIVIKEIEQKLEKEALAQSYTYEPLLQFFAFEHLPGMLQEVSRPFSELAQRMVRNLPANIERKEMLRKLLEAKDCAVRAFIYK